MAEPADKAAPAKKSKKKKKGPDPLIGKVINDRFKVEALLARGGMGKVYKAEQAPLGREVALKVLNPNYHGDHDPEFHKRFFLEASICSKLTHPNTVTIFDYGRTDDDIYYIAMELLEGRTLHRALRDEGRIPPERAMHIARQICRSLREAHSLGVIHRDLKPANIYLIQHGDETDFTKVLDFGLVKDLGDKGEDLTQTGLFMGSPKYMSPEQIRGERVDGRADVYALGVMLYEMLAGKVPFDRPNSVNILMAHVHEAPPPIEEIAPDAAISPLLQQIVMKSIAKAPDDRFAGMDEFLVALKQAASDSGLAISRSGQTAVSGEFNLGGGATGSFPPVQLTGAATPGVLTPSGPLSPSLVGTPSGGIALDDDPFQQKKGRGKLVAGLVFALAAGAAAMLALGGEEPVVPPVVAAVPEPTPAPEPTPPLPAVTPEPAPPVERIATVLVSLRSEPTGATVVIGEERWTTPADVEWTGDGAARGRQVTFQFQLEGHRDFTVTRTITSDALAVNAALEEIQQQRRNIRRPVRRPRPRTTMEETSGPSLGLKGYKAEPY